MPAAVHDFTIEQGTTVNKVFRFKNADGTLINLTGFTARMQVRASTSSDEVLLDASTDNGLMTISPLAGEVQLLLTPAQSAAIAWRKGKYDLEMESASGDVTRYLKGMVFVDREVTR